MIVFKNSNQLSMPNSLIVWACVKVVHSGDWSTAAWNNRLRLQLALLSSKWSILPFSESVLQRFFIGTCDILLNVLLLLSDLRWTCPHLPLSKLYERVKVPFVKRFRLFDIINDCEASAWEVSLKKSVDDFKGASGLISVGVWSSMPFALIMILVENDDEAVVLTIC